MADDDDTDRRALKVAGNRQVRIEPGLLENFRRLSASPASLALNASILKNTRSILGHIGPVDHSLLANGLRHRAMIGPIQEKAASIVAGLSAARLHLTSDQLKAFESGRGYYADLAKLRAIDLERFHRPASRLLAGSYRGLAYDQLLPTTRLLGLDSATLRAAGRMRSPWLDQSDAQAALSHFAELRSIGKATSLPGSYDDPISEALRRSLGDWRDAGSVDLDEARSFPDRAALYADRGLNPALTDFPEEAFEESLDVSGIRGDAPQLLVLFGPAVPAKADEELEEGLARNNRAQDWLQRFETQIRRFIDDNMTAAYGTDWARSKLPNGMMDRWLEKQRRDPNRDRHSRLIAYADFTDYEPIVCRSDVFREVFRPFFARPESFRESMHRLSLPRIEIAHARIITQDDALFFYTEIRRLVTQFGRTR